MPKKIVFEPNILGTQFRATVYENNAGNLENPTFGPWVTADNLPAFMVGWNDAVSDSQETEAFKAGHDFYESTAE